MMKIRDVGFSVFILFFVLIEHLWWNCCDASISKPLPALIEGDIVIDETIHEIIKTKHQQYFRAKRDTVASHVKLWPGGVVPYTIDPNIDVPVRKRIRRAFRHISKRSCIQFIPKMKEHKDYVQFISGTGCYSSIGRKGGAQTISVRRHCEYGAIHEVMHALGFFHEQSRPDRDRHVKILWWNIQPGMEKNFQSYSNGVTDTLHQPYDLKSIMHYGNKAFSKNGEDTIIARKQPSLKLGANVEKLTSVDMNQLNLLYKCRSRGRRLLRYNSCRNVIPGCFYYAVNSDSCESNYEFMGHYCKRSCGFCCLVLWQCISTSNGKKASIKQCPFVRGSGALDCRKRGFRNVPYDLFTHPDPDVPIYLSKNPFACDCTLVWFLREPAADLRRIADLKDMKCASPPKWNGVFLSTINETSICGTVQYKLEDWCAYIGWSFDVNVLGTHRCFDVKRTVLRIPTDILEKHVIAKGLEKHKYFCDCDTVWFIRRLRQAYEQKRELPSISRGYKNLNCVETDLIESMPIYQYTEEMACPLQDITSEDNSLFPMVIIAIPSTCLLLGLLLLGVYCMCRRKKQQHQVGKSDSFVDDDLFSVSDGW